MTAASLKGLEACAGLSILRLNENAFGEDERDALCDALVPLGDTLVELDLSESPLADARGKAYRDAVHAALPNLARLDQETVSGAGNATVKGVRDMVKPGSTLGVDANNDTLGDGRAFDQLEREVNASMRGERDTTAVA